MNQTIELIVDCFGIVHVIELKDVYKTIVSVYKLRWYRDDSPFAFLMQRAFFIFLGGIWVFEMKNIRVLGGIRVFEMNNFRVSRKLGIQ